MAVFPAEILQMVANGCDNGTLKNLRLVGNTAHGVATPLLFESIDIQFVNDHALERLKGISSNKLISSSISRFRYGPVIRDQSKDPKIEQQIAQQNQILSMDTLSDALSDVIRCLVNVTVIELEYPQHGRRYFANSGNLRVLSTLITTICSTPLPNLSSVLIQNLSPSDIPMDLGPALSLKDKASPLSAVKELDLSFYTFTTPVSGLDFTVSNQIDQFLSLFTNLDSLHLGFLRLDENMRSFNWSVLQTSKLSTLKLRNIEISEESLFRILDSSAERLCELWLHDIVLLDGTWASIYDRLSTFEHIMDVTEVHGRRYINGHAFYSELDALAYRQLYAAVDARRVKNGLCTMTSAFDVDSLILRRGFWVQPIDF